MILVSSSLVNSSARTGSWDADNRSDRELNGMKLKRGAACRSLRRGRTTLGDKPRVTVD